MKEKEESSRPNGAAAGLEDDDSSTRIEMTIQELRVTNEDLMQQNMMLKN